MQGVATPYVAACSGHCCGPHIPPGALIDQLVDVHVGNALSGVKGAVGGEALALRAHLAR